MTDPALTSKPEVVCVLGMHRSGTSLIARAGNLLGVYLGPDEHLMPPVEDNPTGFWEHKLLGDLNDEILSVLGGSWHEPPAFPAGWESGRTLGGLRRRAKAVIQEDFAGAALWGWKDPRTCLTLPFWQRFLPPMRYVVCLRNPVDVARSLERRSGFSIQKGMNLWLAYVTSALKHTVGRPRLFVFYEDFMADWRQGLRSLAHFIGRSEQAEEAGVQDALRAFIEADLQHHRTSVGETADDPELAFPAKALFMALRLYVRDREDGLAQQDETLQDALSVFGRYCLEAQAGLERTRSRGEGQTGRGFIGRVADRDHVMRVLMDHLAKRDEATRGGQGARRLATTLRQTVEEQTDHLDRLVEQLEALSSRESELRAMLLDAHEQLLRRDEEIRQFRSRVSTLETALGERTAWAERMVAEAELRGAVIDDLRGQLERANPVRRLATLLRRLANRQRG